MAQNHFIGRVREAAMLRDAVKDVVAGRGRLIMLPGEPGIGKTRLAEETANYAVASGVRVLWGRCWEGGGAPAFWPWIQLIRRSLQAQAGAAHMAAEVNPGLARIAQMLPELRATLALPEPVQHMPLALPLADASEEPARERFRLFDAITNLFKGLADRAALMVVLDDLHAADDDSLVLLQFLARELQQTRILIVATYREVEVRQSVQQAAVLADIAREGTTIPLRGLSADEVAEFIRGTAQVAADAELVYLLHQATNGNPFFLDEIVRLIVAERKLGDAAPWAPGFTIPDSVRTVIRRRIVPLRDQTKSLMTIASVIGKEFDLAVLQEVSGIPGEQLVELLAEAVANGLILEPAGSFVHYRFAHGIIAEALRTDLALSARSQLHERIAAAVERIYAGNLAPYLAQLAHHYSQTLSVGGPDKTVKYSQWGAERARSQLAFAEAARLYDMALSAIAATSTPDEAQRCEILLAMGEALAQGRNLDEARQAFEAAAAVARRLGRSTLLAQSALHASAWFGTFFTIDRALMALVEEALQAVGDADSAIRASLMATLAGERYWSGDRDSGLALSEAAVAMARRLADPRALVSALWIHSQIRWRPEEVERRLASATEIAGLAESIGDYQRALRAHEMRFTALLEMGDMQSVDTEVGAYEALARRAGEQFGIAERLRAAVALLKGNFAQAEREIQEFSGHAQRRQDPALLACAQALVAVLHEEQGRLDPAQLERAAKTLIAQSPALAAQYRVVSAFVHLASGRPAEAQAALESLAENNCAAIPRDWNWLDNVRGLAVLCVVLRDVRHGAVLYELMLPYPDHNITAGWGDVARGAAALYLGLLARLLGRLDDAQAHFERALQLNQRMGARPSLARSQFEYARMLLKRGRGEDRERALDLLGAALATAAALGMAPLEMGVRAALARAAGAADARNDQTEASPAGALAGGSADGRERRPPAAAGGARAAPRTTMRSLPQDPIEPGKVLFGAYEILSTVGSGGMGTVYRARHRSLGGLRAIKIIRPDYADDPGAMALFLRESRALLEIQHAAVVRCHDLLRDEAGRFYLVMELIDGASLEETLRQRVLGEDEVHALLVRLASGLAAAHARGVIHRDIAPANIILEGSRVQRAKLIDFGLAKEMATGDLTIEEGFKGRLAYASPEQFGLFGGTIGPPSDLYSLGLLLAEAATGQRVFGVKTYVDAFEARRRPVVLPAALPASLRDAIKELMAPDPRHRRNVCAER